MKDRGLSVNRHCTCVQTYCPIRGNCVLCVQNHLEHKRHIPECMANLLRDDVRALAGKLELRTGEGRPDDAFWKKMARTDFVAKSIARHGKRAAGAGRGARRGKGRP